MAISQNTYVYMETMEMCANQIPKPEGHGSSSRPRVENGKQQTRLLVYNTYSCHEMAMTKERLINSGLYDLATAYQSVHIN